MTELPDDELDKLFRKSSEEFDPTYEPEDWDALSKRLDQEDGKSPLGWLKKWWPLGMLALLLPMGLGYYWLKNSGSESADLKQNKKEAGAPKTLVDDEGAKTVVEQPDSELNKKNTETEASGISKDLQQLSHQDKKNRITKKSPNNNDFVYSKRQYRIVRNSIGNGSDDFEGISQIRSNKTEVDSAFMDARKKVINTSGVDKSAIHTRSVEKEVEIANLFWEQKKEAAISVNYINPQPFKENDALELPGIELQESMIPSKQENQRDISPKMAVRFGYSPDLTTVGLKISPNRERLFL